MDSIVPGNVDLVPFDDDPSVNPYGELMALAHAHQLVANTAQNSINNLEAEIAILRSTAFEHSQKAQRLKRLAELLPPGDEAPKDLRRNKRIKGC